MRGSPAPTPAWSTTRSCGGGPRRPRDGGTITTLEFHPCGDGDPGSHLVGPRSRRFAARERPGSGVPPAQGLGGRGLAELADLAFEVGDGLEPLLHRSRSVGTGPGRGIGAVRGRTPAGGRWRPHRPRRGAPLRPRPARRRPSASPTRPATAARQYRPALPRSNGSLTPERLTTMRRNLFDPPRRS